MTGVLVTGSASGLGRAIAERFAADGARVAVLDVDADAAAATAAELGTGHLGVGADVRSAEQVRSAVGRVVEAFAGLDVLVNNAGVEAVGPLLETADDEVLRLYDVNVVGGLRCLRAALPALSAAGHGAVVNMSSAAGTAGSPLLAAYSMSKAAVIRMTEALAVELRPTGVRVNAVCPALTGPTRMVDALVAPFEAMGMPFEQVVAKQGGRMGEAREVADMVAFLASPQAGLVNGAHYLVDGGLTAGVL
ncbi:SDR family oxidoreductase [Pseudonocardia sp. NPDC049154]|uniref:SDR family NAD(P)-dependent oxidoreductase n=1 Tax=Pseudonocardia sp. NPDC049154 TaxID=3155501 RepID=UPI003404465A